MPDAARRIRPGLPCTAACPTRTSALPGVCPATCGDSRTFGIERSGKSGGNGSTAYVSSAAPARCPRSPSAAIRAPSSTSSPRAVLTRTAPGFMAAIVARASCPGALPGTSRKCNDTISARQDQFAQRQGKEPRGRGSIAPAGLTQAERASSQKPGRCAPPASRPPRNQRSPACSPPTRHPPAARATTRPHACLDPPPPPCGASPAKGQTYIPRRHLRSRAPSS